MAVSHHEAREIVLEEVARRRDTCDATIEVFYRVGMRCLIDIAGERAEGEYWEKLNIALRMRAVAGLFASFTIGKSSGEFVLLPRPDGERWLTWYSRWRQILVYLWDHREQFGDTGVVTQGDVTATLAAIDRWIARFQHELIVREYLILSAEELRGASGISTSLLLSLLGRERMSRFVLQMNELLPVLRSVVREMSPGNSTLN